MTTVGDVVAVLERFAPPALTADWDNVGLLLGDRGTPISKAMTCLTLTPEVADEAVADNVGLVVTHHPILFRGVKRINTDTPEGASLWKLARAGVAVYSPHTAFDNTTDGINDRIAAKLGLVEVQPLRRGRGPEVCKFVVFVPEADLAKVTDAAFAAGAGEIGRYRECGFRTLGTGTFFGGDDTNPVIGQRGRREEVAEWRLEVVCFKNAVERVVAAVKKAHPYEEPAFDVYPLVPAHSRVGEGRLGSVAIPLPLGALAHRVRSALGSGPVQVVGDPSRLVSTVAIVCGAGGELREEAEQAGADVFLTGEMRFHDYLAAMAAGQALILPGHYATERFAVEELAEWLTKSAGVNATASTAERDPVTWF